MFSRFTMCMVAALSVLLPACGNENLSGENHGNLLTTASGLVLTQSEHEIGWGKSDCTLCHNYNNIHLADLTGTNIDVAAIRETVFAQGTSSCATCHGTNGL